MERKYLQVEEYVRGPVLRGNPSERLPAIRELMTRFGVSQVTVTRALDELEREGVIVRKWGAGIMPAAVSHATAVQRGSGGRMEKPRKILYSYAAYYSGGLWNNLNIVEMYAVQRRVNLIFHKRTRETSMEEFIDYAKSQKKLAGLIYSESSKRLTEKELAMLGELPCKVFLFWSRFDYPDLPENVFLVSTDPVEPARMLARHLLEHGHRRIGFVAHIPKSDNSEIFLKAAAEWIRTHGGELKPEHIFRSGTKPWDDALQAAAETVRKNIATIKSDKLTALIFNSSDGALAAIRPLRENGLFFPRDVSLVGNGYMPLYDILPDVPDIAAVNVEKMVRFVIDSLLSRKGEPEKKTWIDSRLIVYGGVTTALSPALQSCDGSNEETKNPFQKKELLT